MPTPLSEDKEIPVEQRFTMWGDSDIPYLQQMMSPTRIQQSLKKGLCFAKIGAKITETSQPLDIGAFFKVMKVSGKHMSSIGIDKPLTCTTDVLFKRLKKDKVLNLAYLKENSLKEKKWAPKIG